MSQSIHTYHEHLPILTDELIKNRSLSLMLLDISPFSAIEEQYGIHTYTLVRQQLFALLAEQSGKDYRKEDMLALEEPGGLRILLFLSPRRHASAGSYESLESLRVRFMSVLIPKLLRTASPYLKGSASHPDRFCHGHLQSAHGSASHNSAHYPRGSRAGKIGSKSPRKWKACRS